MARSSTEVTYGTLDVSRIPDKLTEGVALLMKLRDSGLLDDAGQRVHIRRQGGYCGLDVMLLLLLFYSSSASNGVRKLWEVLGRRVKEVAAVGGRCSLPSPAALSRALGAAEFELVRQWSIWLLSFFAGIDVVLQHPAVKSYDARGEGWHVYDLDPTVKAIRQRDLPDGEDLPEPRRRAAGVGAPGYSGRKRGDIQHRQTTVQHSGSGSWIHAHLSLGNGEGIVDFEHALDSIVQTNLRLGHPLWLSLVRMDGEYGSVPFFSACRARALPFITRLNRPKLYEDPDVLARLRAARWRLVPDSGAGPQRTAADLGILTVAPGERTRRPDGTRYEPVEIRVVASIFPKCGEAKRGRTLDGWQVELFAVDLPADAWPAPDAIAAYFGRSAEENRFAQEDRELGLDRTVSQHLPGQEMAVLVGLTLWNIRMVEGFALDVPPCERPVQQLRRLAYDDRVPEHWPRDPVLRDNLDELDWTAMLGARPGWTWDADAGELLCEDGRALTLTTVRAKEQTAGRTGIIFRRPMGGCEDCMPRSSCLSSARPMASKHSEFLVPTAIASKLRDRLRLVRQQPSTNDQRRGALSIPEPGQLVCTESLFLPAAARQGFQRTLQDATLHVEVELGPRGPTGPRLVADSVAARQRRRLTWDQNLARYELPAGSEVRIHVAAGAALRRMLGDTQSRDSCIGTCG